MSTLFGKEARLKNSLKQPFISSAHARANLGVDGPGPARVSARQGSLIFHRIGKLTQCGPVLQYSPKHTQTIAAILGGAGSKSARGGPFKEGEEAMLSGNHAMTLWPIAIIDWNSVNMLYVSISNSVSGSGTSCFFLLH